jgi:tetratricopeptide (TPR) repeat protein
LRKKGKVEALKAAQRAVRAAPESPLALSALISALLQNNCMSEAHTVAEKLREIAPDNAKSHRALACVALRRGWWPEAEKHARRALQIDPASSIGFRHLGNALFATRRYQDAARAFFEASRLDPLDDEARDGLVTSLDSFPGRRPPWSERIYRTMPKSVPRPLRAVITLCAIVLMTFAAFKIGIVFGSLFSAFEAGGLLSAAGIWVWGRRWRQAPPEIRQIYLAHKYRWVRRIAPDWFEAKVLSQASKA